MSYIFEALAEVRLTTENIQKVIKMYPRDNDWKKLITKHRREIDNLRRGKDLSKKVEDELMQWALKNGEIRSDDVDELDDFIASIMDESVNENYNQDITLADLFMLFIYVEIIGMVGAFYSTSRIPVTLPIIIAITALCRLIVMESKEMDAVVILGEAGAILILAIAAYIMSLKDKISLEKVQKFGDKKE